MSQIQGRVLDSSIYAWIADVAVTVTTENATSKAYVDGSLNVRDASIDALIVYNAIQDTSILYNVNGLIASDASITALQNGLLTSDSSIVTLHNGLITSDSSIIALEASVGANTSSISNLNSYNVTQDTSILALESYVNIIDTSIGIVIDDVLDNSNSIDQLILDVSALEAYDNAIDGSITTLQNNKLDNTTDTFTGVLTIDGSIVINGDIYQDGSTYITSAEILKTKNDFIILREDAVVHITDGSISGLRVTKANGTSDVILGTSNDAIMRIGWEGDVLQAIATREDEPIDGWYVYWDDASSMLKTYDIIGYFDSSLSNYLLITDFDASLSELKSYTDGSLNSKVNTDDFDSSIAALPTYDYVDGSLNNKVNITDFDSSIAALPTYDYIDGSLNNKSDKLASINYKTSAYTISANDNNNVVDASGTFTVTLPNSLDTGFQTTIVNSGSGTITLDASILLTRDSSVLLTNQYSAASAIHYGSGRWMAFGDLN